MTTPLEGIIPIIPTPFQADESIDWDAFAKLIDFACGSGAAAFCLPAYASEFYKLSDAEKQELVARAVLLAAGRLPVVAQANSPSARIAAQLAAAARDAGAAAVCVAVPRLLPLTEADLFRYFERILSVLDVPLVIQDFNPGGPSVSVDFIARLHEAYPLFAYVKLEEARMESKIKAILDRTSGGVAVLEGWGGMYMLELIPAGIAGVMPALSTADILARIWRLARGGNRDAACEIFQQVLPQIVFSLANMEFFHQVEKLLLVARGLLPNANVREPGTRLAPGERAYVDFLNRRILTLVSAL